jgi:hypothetical protein
MEEKPRWFNPDKPLWLPEGTVRALLVLGLTMSLIVIMGKFAILKEEPPAGVLQLMQALLPAIVLLIKDYMETRSNGKDKSNAGPTG